MSCHVINQCVPECPFGCFPSAQMPSSAVPRTPQEFPSADHPACKPTDARRGWGALPALRQVGLAVEQQKQRKKELLPVKRSGAPLNF